MPLHGLIPTLFELILCFNIHIVSRFLIEFINFLLVLLHGVVAADLREVFVTSHIVVEVYEFPVLEVQSTSP